MSDEKVLPVPGQVEGTTAGQASGEGQSQAAAKSEQEQASQQGTVEAKPVTAQDLQALEDRLAKQIQSQVDKSSARVQKKLAEVDQAVAVLRASGREITDADVKALKQNAAAQAMTEPEEPIAEQKADPLDATQWPQDDPVTRKVIELQLKYGVEIKSDHPAAAKIVRGKGAVEFVKSYEAALIEATSQSTPKTEEKKPTSTPAARIPSGGGVPVENKTGRQYLKEASRG